MQKQFTSSLFKVTEGNTLLYMGSATTPECVSQAELADGIYIILDSIEISQVEPTSQQYYQG
jgi:hypothetical protein